MKKDCVVLINSCDKYSEAWYPFFTLFKKYWPDCPYQLYLNTETMQCTVDGVETITQQNADKISWTDRLIDAVNAIDSDYILLLLDDFFLTGPVKSSEVADKLSIMNREKDIAVFYFKHSTGQSSDVLEYGNYIRMDTRKKYILNFQAGLWRKSALVELIKRGASPWDIEEGQNFVDIPEWRFYCPADGSYTNCSNDVFPYLWAIQTGYGICKSKWLWNNKKLFKKEGIKVKFEKLQKMSRFEYYFGVFKRRIKQKLGRMKR